MGSEVLLRVEDHGKQGEDHGKRGFTASRGSWEARLYRELRIMGSKTLPQVEDHGK